MGKALLILTLLLSSSVFAEDIVQMDPSQHECAEMQEVLKRDTQILLKGLLGFYDIYFASGGQCPMLHKSNISYVFSKDKTFCLMGYTCRMKP